VQLERGEGLIGVQAEAGDLAGDFERLVVAVLAADGRVAFFGGPGVRNRS
jgi:hypothetical protein